MENIYNFKDGNAIQAIGNIIMDTVQGITSALYKECNSVSKISMSLNCVAVILQFFELQDQVGSTWLQCIMDTIVELTHLSFIV